MALRIWDEVFTGPEQLLQWIKSLNPGLHTETWKVLDSKDEITGRQLILLVNQDLANAIKKTSYNIYTGLSEGNYNALGDYEEDPDRAQVTVGGTLVCGHWWQRGMELMVAPHLRPGRSSQEEAL
jgi:hypothetical protein